MEMMQLHMMHIRQICIDEVSSEWEVHFECAAHLRDGLLQSAAAKLAAAFSLQKVDMICDGDGSSCQISSGSNIADQYEVTDCTGEPLPDDIPLPPEPPNIEIGATEPPMPTCTEIVSDDYEAAYRNLYGEKKDSELLWGKKIVGKVRPIDNIIEEEKRVVIEGEFVKIMDKDSNLTAFDERELRSGAIMLKFGISDGSNGIFIKMRFDDKNGKEPRKECNNFKGLLKPGMRLRLQGNVEPDQFEFNEFIMHPTGIMKAAAVAEERMDNAVEKRVELHCHTKMSKMDGLTPMEDLVKKAIKWGHKALAITDHGVVQAFPFC